MESNPTTPARAPRLRERFLIGPGHELRRRSWNQVFEVVVQVAAGTALWLGAQGQPFVAAAGAALVALGIDNGVALARLFGSPTWRLDGAVLCLRERCLPLEQVQRVRLETYRPHLLRFDHPPVLRLVLEGAGLRWAVPLTHENWDRLWDRLREQRPALPPWPQHAALLRALAQSREVPYYLPPGVAVDDLGLPGWAGWLTFGLVGGVLLLGLYPHPALQKVPSPVWLGAASAIGHVATRKTRRLRVEVSMRDGQKRARP